MKDKISQQIKILKTKWQKLNEREKILTILLLAIIPLVLYIQLYFIPTKDKIAKIRKEKIQTKEQINRFKLYQLKTKKLTQKLEKIKKITIEAEKILPEKTEISKLLRELAGEQKRFGIEIIKLNTKKEEYKDDYAIIPLELNVQGEFNNIILFLDNIRKKDRILNPQAIDLKKKDQILNGKIEIYTYRLLTEQEKQQREQKKEKTNKQKKKK